MRLFSQLRQKQAETASHAVARQNGFYDRYFEWLDAHPGDDRAARMVTVIARSPLSPVVRALLGRVGELCARGVVAKLLVARLEPEEALREAAGALVALSPQTRFEALARWANHNCLLDAHEQLTLGTGMCWSGDMMRRDPGKRDGLDLFEVEAPQTVRLGALAFGAIWDISSSIPAHRLRNRPARPNGAYLQALSATLARPSALDPRPKPELVRH